MILLLALLVLAIYHKEIMPVAQDCAAADQSLDLPHPDLWAIGDPIFPRGSSVHDGPEVLDGPSPAKNMDALTTWPEGLLLYRTYLL